MTVESKKHVIIQEEVPGSEPDKGIDAYRQKATKILQLHAAYLLYSQDSFLRAIEQLLREAGLRAQDAVELVPTIIQAGILLKDPFPFEQKSLIAED